MFFKSLGLMLQDHIRGQIEFQNKRLKNQLDSLFVQKKNFEERLGDLQKKEDELETLAKLKVKELGEAGIKEHEKLEKDALRLRELVQNKKTELAEISYRQLIINNECFY